MKFYFIVAKVEMYYIRGEFEGCRIKASTNGRLARKGNIIQLIIMEYRIVKYVCFVNGGSLWL